MGRLEQFLFRSSNSNWTSNSATGTHGLRTVKLFSILHTPF